MKVFNNTYRRGRVSDHRPIIAQSSQHIPELLTANITNYHQDPKYEVIKNAKTPSYYIVSFCKLGVYLATTSFRHSCFVRNQYERGRIKTVVLTHPPMSWGVYTHPEI